MTVINENGGYKTEIERLIDIDEYGGWQQLRGMRVEIIQKLVVL